MKKYGKPAPAVAVLLALVCWCAWYARPIKALDLNPELEPASISVSITRFGEPYEGAESLHFDLDADTSAGQSLLTDLEAIVIRRSPLNPLRSFYWRYLTDVFPPTISGRQTAPGQYQFMIHIWDSGAWIALQFNLDEWEYDLPEQPQYLPCRVSDGVAAGQAIGDELWEMAQRAEYNS